MLFMSVGMFAEGYVKITSTADLTDGTYLIVYETDGLAFDGSLETLDAVSNTISVTINNNVITSTPAVDASTFAYDATNKTLKSASGYYIGKTANSNGLDYNTGKPYTNELHLVDVHYVLILILTKNVFVIIKVVKKQYNYIKEHQILHHQNHQHHLLQKFLQ